MFRPAPGTCAIPWESRVRSPDARRPLPARIDLKHPPYTPSFIDDLHRWCRDNLHGDCYIAGTGRWVECHFQFVDDAALFRLFHG